MFKGIVNTDTSVALNTNVPLRVVRNTNANTSFNSTTNEININASGYYNVLANIVATSTPGGTISAQLYANGAAIDGAISTEVVAATGTTTFTIIDNVRVDPTLDNSVANVSIRFDAEVTVNDAVVLVEKVR